MIKYIIVIVFLKTILIRTNEEPKHRKEMFYQDSVKWSPSYKSILAPNGKNNILQYDYQDWEGTRPDDYNYEISSPVASSSSSTSLTAVSSLTSTLLTTRQLSYSSTTERIVDIPDLPTEYIFEDTTTTTSTTIIPPKNPMVDEIIKAKNKMQGGYCTASMMVFLKMIQTKDIKHVQQLIFGFSTELSRLNSKHELIMFGPPVQELLSLSVQVISGTGPVHIQSLIEYGNFLLEDRRTRILPDVNAVFDVLDVIYNDDDLKNVADVLKDIKEYPANKTAVEISHEAFIAFVLTPLGRIEGTPKARMLLLELNNVAERRLPGRPDGGRRMGVELLRTDKTKKPQVILRTKGEIEFMNFSYVQNKTIMRRLRHKMKAYKEKFQQIKIKERGKSKRGPTTTTTTTTVMPPMHKSNYYIRRYVKRNLKRRTTTTKKTTEFKWRYYGKIRKFNFDSGRSCDNFNETISKCSSENNLSDYEGFYSGSIENEGSTEISFENIKNLKENSRNYNEESRNIEGGSEKNEFSYRHNVQNSNSNEEMELGMNLKGAVLEKDLKVPKQISNRGNRLRDESYSDDEPFLKSQIYKVFGFNFTVSR